MKLEGSLDAFSLPDIFALLSMTKKTGGLHLRREGAHGVVWLTTGALTGGASDVNRQALARRLIGSGQLSDEALQAAIDQASNDDSVGVARSVQQAGALDEGVLHDMVSEHIVDTVFDLLRWPDGEFSFSVDEGNPDDVGVSRQVDEVVTEARRRLESWGNVAATIPSPQTVLSLAATPPEDPQLSRDEWALLALIDGQRTVGEVVGLCGRGDYNVVSALADLVTRGLLRTGDGEDGVQALVRRHSLLARLECVAPAAPAEVAEPVATSPAEEPEPAEEPVAPVTSISAPRVPSQPVDREEAVTPKRPEPFLPKRQPEHPEPIPAALAATAGGAAAAAAAPSPLIERDPSVNKSLLLRLIAGVRGL
ncbi:MAG TPA: DUF4388 domain-containing protein [Mycobacteriales bacterium]|nr:DUF4388 domain-containing protein [Mycobacteriales bacterium]